MQGLNVSRPAGDGGLVLQPRPAGEGESLTAENQKPRTGFKGKVMRNGVLQTAKPRGFRCQLSSPAGGRVRLPFALIVSVLAMGVAASATLGQEQPQPVLPQQKGIGQSEQERQFDAQARELETRRIELERSLQRTEMQVQQLVLEQDQQRRRLQKDLSEIRERLRDVDSQLADLPRQRLRAKYLAALQTLEQARGKRQQAEDQAEAARLAEQDASILVDRLRQLQGQIPPIQLESVCGEQQVRAVSGASKEPGNTETRRDSLLQQLESLRGEIRRTGEQIKAVTAQMDTTRESLDREVSGVRTDLQRMGQTLGRIEQERLEAQSSLKTGMEGLRGQLEQVQQLRQTQRALDLALLQARRSTVGSAAYR